MARAVRTQLAGFREAREALQELSKATQRNVGKRALLRAAEVIADAWRAAAPVSSSSDDPTKGSLRSSIKVVGDRPGKGRAKVAVLAEDPAAVPYEYGRKGQPARPTFRPTADRYRTAAARVFGDALRPEIEAAAQRAARKVYKK